MGKIFVIDGTDGSGKQTQFEFLKRRLSEDGVDYRTVSFPNYDSPSSSLVKMYLSGEFGDDPQKISPYIASTFYAADRYATFQTGFKEYYDKQEGRKYPCSNQIVKCGIITTDRNLAIDFMNNKNVVKKWERKDRIMWELDNGEQWLWQHWNENCRGYRFYKIAIDKMIDRDLFYCLVHPY